MYTIVTASQEGYVAGQLVVWNIVLLVANWTECWQR